MEIKLEVDEEEMKAKYGFYFRGYSEREHQEISRKMQQANVLAPTVSEKETDEFLTPDSLEDQVLQLQFDMVQLMKRIKELEEHNAAGNKTKPVDDEDNWKRIERLNKEARLNRAEKSSTVEPHEKLVQLQPGDVLTDKGRREYQVVYGVFNAGGTQQNGFVIVPKPKRLTGFVNIYRMTIDGAIYNNIKPLPTRESADADANEDPYHMQRIACIDLSQFEEGYGL